MRYLVSGYYGMRNIGDDILLYVTLGELKRLDPEAVCSVISSVPILAPPGVPVEVCPAQRFGTARQLVRNDIWFFGGGGLLQDASPRSLPALSRLRQLARVAKCLRRKIALVGIGIGPLETRRGREIARSLLEAADFVSVRDRESAALSLELVPQRPVPVGADLAFLLPQQDLPAAAPPANHEGGKTLGVSLLSYAASRGGDQREDFRACRAVASALNQVLKRHPDWNVKLFEFFTGSEEYGDGKVLRVLQQHLENKDRVCYHRYDGDFLATYRQIRQCQAFIGMRFHSCLLAYLAGVPCLLVDYHPKCASLAARVQFPPQAVVPLELLTDSGALSGRLEALLEGGRRFLAAVSPEQMTLEARATFTAFGDWIRNSGRLSSLSHGAPAGLASLGACRRGGASS